MDWDNITEDNLRLQAPPEVLAAYTPDRDALFTLLRRHVTDEMLEIVAMSDYGLDFEAHLSGLKRIRAGIDLKTPLRWEPKEVLELFRWSEAMGQRDFQKAEDFHLARAFCCQALLLIPYDGEGHTDFETDTLAPLIESCIALGQPYRDKLSQYLMWSLSQIQLWNSTLLYVAFGLTFVVGNSLRSDSPLLPILVEWFVQAHRELVPQYKEYGNLDERIFLDEDYGSVSLRPENWRQMAVAMKERVPLGGDFSHLLDLFSKRWEHG